MNSIIGGTADALGLVGAPSCASLSMVLFSPYSVGSYNLNLEPNDALSLGFGDHGANIYL
jgi:hypothetical protein